jgi:RNA-directed DNA polymerase
MSWRISSGVRRAALISSATRLGNIRRLQEYRYQVVQIWHKWLERRTRGRSFKWDNFNAFLIRHPLPAARIIHRYT